MSLVIVGAEIGGGRRADVSVNGGVITAIGTARPHLGDDVIDADGGALLPGLHDHHIHLHSLAAMMASTQLGPPVVNDRQAFAAALRRADHVAPADAWLRGVGYHESVAGHLDANVLDAIVAARPVRVQHRTGGLWILNHRALDEVSARSTDHPGIERDELGEPSGRLRRADQWLRTVVPPTPVDLGRVGREAAAAGVTGFTDADPHRDPLAVAHLVAAITDGTLPQSVHAMGQLGLELPVHRRLTLGPVKVILDDVALPPIEDLTVTIRAAHAEGRAIAVHCVTRAQLVVALAALDETGAATGDRIEHGAIIPSECVAELRRLRLRVVTQPGLVAERGDQYRRDVDPDDLDQLYRCRTLLAAGIPVAGSTDAPFTAADPWAAIRAAVVRRTPSGQVLGPREAVGPEVALRLFAGSAARPASHRVAIGAPAELCLLDEPIAVALSHPHPPNVVATVIGGEVVHR